MKKSHLARFLAAILSIQCAILCPVSAEEASPDAPPESSGEVIATNAIPGWPQGPDILSGSAIVVEADTGTVLYAKDIDEQLLPSSSVKIMTSLVALENSALTDEVTITETGTAGVTDGGANISVEEGEIFTMEQCLYAIMLASANDVSLQVAEFIGGSQEHFVEMMNEKAASLGCTHTHFTNSTGLSDEENTACTTAHDLAIIIQEAMKNRTFRRIVSTLYYTIPATNMSEGERTLTNSFGMIDPNSEFYYAPSLGGKEGYTDASGSVLACMAEMDDMKLVCAVMNGRADETVYEAAAIMNYAFQNFQMLDLGSNDFSVASGGTVCVPVTASAADVIHTDTALDDGTLDRQYVFNDIPVGTAKAVPEAPEDDSVAKASQANLDDARAFKNGQATIIYILIAAAGFAVFGWLLRILLRLLGKKKR